MQMSEPIKVGDLVVVVKPHSCCGFLGRLGRIFRVDNIGHGPNRCGICGHYFGDDHADAWEDRADWASRLDWLKRIPPLSELEGEKRDEEITA